jgi:hypothetical protein
MHFGFSEIMLDRLVDSALLPFVSRLISKGRFAFRHEREGGMRWTLPHQLTSDDAADGEVVWF